MSCSTVDKVDTVNIVDSAQSAQRAPTQRTVHPPKAHLGSPTAPVGNQGTYGRQLKQKLEYVGKAAGARRHLSNDTEF